MAYWFASAFTLIHLEDAQVPVRRPSSRTVRLKVMTRELCGWPAWHRAVWAPKEAQCKSPDRGHWLGVVCEPKSRRFFPKSPPVTGNLTPAHRHESPQSESEQEPLSADCWPQLCELRKLPWQVPEAWRTAGTVYPSTQTVARRAKAPLLDQLPALPILTKDNCALFLIKQLKLPLS